MANKTEGLTFLQKLKNFKSVWEGSLGKKTVSIGTKLQIRYRKTVQAEF